MVAGSVTHGHGQWNSGKLGRLNDAKTSTHQVWNPKPLTEDSARLIGLLVMGEYKAKIEQRKRLVVRLQFPTHEPMVVEADLSPGFLERVWKLMDT
jgi:hypothetical protein